MQWSTPLEIGKREGAFSIASIHSTQQRKERRILTNRHQLAIAERPSGRGEIKGHDPDFGYELIGHNVVLLGADSSVMRRENSCQRNYEIKHKVGRHVVVGLASANVSHRTSSHSRVWGSRVYLRARGR